MATLKITPKIMSIGGRMIQISNIAEAGLWQDVSGRSKAKKLFFVSFLFFIIGAIHSSGSSGSIDYLTFWLFFISVCAVILGFILFFGQKYELILQTNAGKITPLTSTDKKLLDEILLQLQVAMSHENPTQNYAVTIADNIINSVVGSSVGGNIELRHTK